MTPQTTESPAQIFEPNEVYLVAEIMKKLKFSDPETVTDKMRKYGVKAYRWGGMRYLGADLNQVLEADRGLKSTRGNLKRE